MAGKNTRLTLMFLRMTKFLLKYEQIQSTFIRSLSWGDIQGFHWFWEILNYAPNSKF